MNYNTNTYIQYYYKDAIERLGMQGKAFVLLRSLGGVIGSGVEGGVGGRGGESGAEISKGGGRGGVSSIEEVESDGVSA